MIKLAKPYIPEAAVGKAVEVLRSGNLVQGKYVTEFEKSLQDYLNVKNAVIVSSGTAALHLALLSLDIKPGDEVIVPAFTFPASANTVRMVGAETIFVDINLTDFCIDAAKIEEKITTKTKAIMVVHEFGQSAEIGKIISIADRYGLNVIEDAACALGTEFNQKKAGTFGNIGCFSFHPRKAITTGEGGLVVTADDRLAERVRSLRNHGVSIENDKTDFIYAGLNYRMTDFQAVLGIAQLAEIDELIHIRNEIAGLYNAKFKTISGITQPAVLKNRKPVFQTYHILLPVKTNRDYLIRALKKEGIETNIGAQALPCLTYYKKQYDLREGDLPNSVKAYRQGLALPIGKHVTAEDVSHVFTNIVKHLDNC